MKKFSKSDTGSRKPSWSVAPDWAMYLTMDPDGEWIWHQLKPYRIPAGWMSGGGRSGLKSQMTHAASGNDLDRASDWKKSLEKRP